MPNLATINLNLGMGGSIGPPLKVCLEVGAEQRQIVSVSAEMRTSVEVAADQRIGVVLDVGTGCD